MSDLSVVIPTHNRKEILRRSLEALLDQTLPPESYEIVIVDDGSTDETETMVRGMMLTSPASLRYFYQSNKGPAAARNLGIEEAEAEVILLIDDDVIASSSLLHTHLQGHQAGSRIAILGKTEIHPEITLTPFLEFIMASELLVAFDRIERGQDVPYRYFVTSNVSLRKEHLWEVGMFDEVFKSPGYEDTELAYRLSQYGIQTIYNPRAVAYHLDPMTLESFIHRQRRVGRNAVLFQRKYPELRVASRGTTPRLLAAIVRHLFFQALFLLSRQKRFQWRAWKYQLDYHCLLGMREGWRSQRSGQQDGAIS